MSIKWWCHPTISSSPFPFFSCFNLFHHQSLFQGVSSSHQVAKVLEFQLQHQCFKWIFRTDEDWLAGSPWSPKDSQESSPTSQSKSINSLLLSFCYSPTLNPYMTTRKTVALTRWNFVGKIISLLFNMLSRVIIFFFFQGATCFSFMAAITICSDFGALENKVSHYFHCFLIYLPWSDGTRCHVLSFLNVKL